MCYPPSPLLTSFSNLAVRILKEYANTDVAQVLANVTAANASAIINQGGGVWDEITTAHPAFANDVLKKVFPVGSNERMYNLGLRGPAVPDRNGGGGGGHHGGFHQYI